MFVGKIRGGGFDHSGYVDRAGGDMNASTDTESTDYHETVPVSELPLALWLEASRMRAPLADVSEAAFATEREVVTNEWRERYGDRAYGHVYNIADSQPSLLGLLAEGRRVVVAIAARRGSFESRTNAARRLRSQRNAWRTRGERARRTISPRAPSRSRLAYEHAR